MPEFQCLDDQGKMWDSREYVGKQTLVIYFYPSDFAFCCSMPPSLTRGIITTTLEAYGQNPRREAGGMLECARNKWAEV